ncbi:hypothetical protein, partial [Cupriavidus sp. AcVe19-1a]|uniref:hypothetical protein n=1 Tax=Cupriavidus sp. AcVe19-1a TaxID=2821359 RepID=UPI001AEA13B4
GFDDGRVTLGNDWGQGAHSALPMVGAFYDMALRAGTIDANAKLGPTSKAAAPKPRPQDHRRLPFWPF